MRDPFHTERAELFVTTMSGSCAEEPQKESDGMPAAVYMCPEPGCGRQFNRKYTLTEHSKTHSGEKPHVCPVRSCSKRFSTSGNLSRHKRLHGTIQPLECPVDGCYCTFPSNNKLEKHMKFHMGSPVQVCKIMNCGKTFSTTGNLNRHMKHHHQMDEDHQTPTMLLQPPSGLKQSPTGVDQHVNSAVPSLKPNHNQVHCPLPLPPMRQPSEHHLWTSDLVDVLSTIFDEDAAAAQMHQHHHQQHHHYLHHPDMHAKLRENIPPPLQFPGQDPRASILDDMISFHVSNLN